MTYAYAIIPTIATLSLIIGIYYFLDYRKEKKEWRKEVQSFYDPHQDRKSFIVVLGDRFDKTDAAKPMYERLRQSNIPLTPSEFIGAQIVVLMGGIIILGNMFNLGMFVAAMINIVIIEIGKRILFKLRKNKMKERFAEQLPEICRILANATRSGMTLNQGIQMVAQEINEPARMEFRRLAHELSLGIDFNTSIRQMEKRVDNQEFKLFTATILIQKKAGGNLSAVLDEMSQTLDERKILKQEVKTMTAEQRYISYLVPVIPIFLVLMMNNIIDGFLDPLFSGLGIILLVFFIGGTILTFLLVRKVTNIKV